MKDLILPEDEVRPAARWAAGFSAAVFLLICVGTLIVDTIHPLKIVLVGAEANAEAELAAEARFLDGTAAANLERQIKIRSRVQAFAGPFATAAHLRLGRTSDSNSMLVGQDAWLFLRSRCDFTEQMMSRSMTTVPRVIRAIDTRVRRSGHRLIVAPVPRKAAICFELLDGDASELDFDRQLLAAIDATQVEMINVIDQFRAMPSLDAYLQFDSHWAEQGVQAFVDELLARLDNQASHRADVELIHRVLPPQDADLLMRLRLTRDHPATDFFFDLPDRLAVKTQPPFAVERFQLNAKDQISYATVALIGTSFSAGSSVVDRLAGELNARVLGCAQGGVKSLVMLGHWADAFLSRGLKQAVILELPVFQAALLERSSPEMMAGLVQLFRATSSDGMELWDGLETSTTAQELRQGSLVWSNGNILTSGDGVLFVEITLDCPKSANLTIFIGHMRFPVPLTKGQQRVVLPVLERAEIVGSLRVLCDESLPDDTILSIRVVGDPSGTPGRPVVLREETSSVWRATPLDTTVGVDDFIDFSWEGPVTDVSVVLTGTGRTGRAIKREVTLGHPRSNLARIACGEFAGGELATVEVQLVGATSAVGILKSAGVGSPR